ncbi:MULTISPECIES: glycosyltransferase family 4 protein [unclassified Streptomyces]|uniref:glycosyltransferase family 4 protein n=1 Tax=unclassified Streptomyces TaxID=2593676 RepID=UPI000887B199|nr:MULTISPECIES: glycosyltransferase family 4 protein [unclassified Streptomyces]PBC84294.1 glycosyltransferase involved in cell wall bisynthesis [Streptomyces sp. 2321.6]SDR32710.1 Glycosyltransferase involved in cell wall bisynthesis [Streptomyces sp. KS_16]SED26348.1 Glycosyltransferase involved in cell wall bisynthesis [Streptomyces sp. 2133.1]SNC70376.1 Glycosyltransferase involved in cell wall bisynthesis [Streptomyces sp. 2114.4]
MNTTVATALDLPFPSPGGSVELFLDLYTGPQPHIPARAFMLAPARPSPGLPAGLDLLPIVGKCLEGPAFHRYVAALRQALAGAIDPNHISVLHLQHLTFGGTPALIKALPEHPRIALVHGTDLLFAESHRDQHKVLTESVKLADAIVVPTPAMADRLLRIAPTTDRTKIAHVPWGIPDQLLARPPHRSPRPAGSPFRLLYAGRLTPEKGAENLLLALAAVQGVELSIAAPQDQFHTLTRAIRQSGVKIRYLGWLRRPQLWRTFTDHDVLVMPSTTLEALGLVALEAQACGLPVLYQPVPGLAETLAASGTATDFTHPAAVARDIDRLRTTPGLLAALQQAGRNNAARYPLSATAKALTELGHRIS